ncbi:MAG: hypothetical protein IPJ51_10615 [Saprospiraceae bacterium]|nr:hypothetical protein [Saprospiraceae bacterium]
MKIDNGPIINFAFPGKDLTARVVMASDGGGVLVFTVDHRGSTLYLLNFLSILYGSDIRNHPFFSGEGLWPYGNVRDQLNFIKMITTGFPSEVQKMLTPEEVGRLRVLNKL